MQRMLVNQSLTAFLFFFLWKIFGAGSKKSQPNCLQWTWGGWLEKMGCVVFWDTFLWHFGALFWNTFCWDTFCDIFLHFLVALKSMSSVCSGFGAVDWRGWAAWLEKRKEGGPLEEREVNTTINNLKKLQFKIWEVSQQFNPKQKTASNISEGGKIKWKAGEPGGGGQEETHPLGLGKRQRFELTHPH